MMWAELEANYESQLSVQGQLRSEKEIKELRKIARILFKLLDPVKKFYRKEQMDYFKKVLYKRDG